MLVSDSASYPRTYVLSKLSAEAKQRWPSYRVNYPGAQPYYIDGRCPSGWYATEEEIPKHEYELLPHVTD